MSVHRLCLEAARGTHWSTLVAINHKIHELVSLQAQERAVLDALLTVLAGRGARPVLAAVA